MATDTPPELVFQGFQIYFLCVLVGYDIIRAGFILKPSFW